MENTTSSKTTGVIGTVAFHAALLALLLYFGLQPQLPIPPEEGILINFGNSEVGMGNIEPSVAEEEQSAPSAAQAAQERATLTQDFEDAPTIKERPNTNAKREVKKPIESKSKVVAAATPSPIPVEKPREVNKKALFPGKSTSNLPSSGEGEGGGSGNQGRLDGSPNSGSRVGGASGGGNGKGASFSLAGRRVVGALPNPSYNVQASGKVVIAITVDRNGKVTKAEYSPKGSTTQDARLVSAALSAAQKAKFNVDQNAASVQSGNITYIFNLN